MDFANIQAQLANLTSQLSQIAEKTRMQSVPTFGVSYGQGNQTPQLAVNEDAWGYQSYDQPSNHMFSNIYNSDGRGYSDYMWGEPQQVQQGGYWQQEDEFYSRPMQPPQPPPPQFQSNSSMPVDYDEILDVLTSLTQGSQQEEYLQPSEEFYQWPYAPSQPSTQPSQPNSGSPMDNDNILQILTSLKQGLKDQAKEMSELKNQLGEMIEFMGQIQEQSELSNSTIENPKEGFETAEAITLRSGMEDGAELKMTKHTLEVDEQLLQEEGEEQPLPQPPKAPTPCNSGNVVPNSILSNPIPPNVPFPRRFLQSKEEEKDILEALPKVQSNILILGTTNQFPECVELFTELCTTRRVIQEKEVPRECVELVNEDVLETTITKEVVFYDTGQVTTITCNLAKLKVPEIFEDVVFILEFEKASKPSSSISISFYTNYLLILMIQAPKLEFRPLPDHFKYHPPFKDKLMHSKKGDQGIAPQSDLRP